MMMPQMRRWKQITLTALFIIAPFVISGLVIWDAESHREWVCVTVIETGICVSRGGLAGGMRCRVRVDGGGFVTLSGPRMIGDEACWWEHD